MFLQYKLAEHAQKAKGELEGRVFSGKVSHEGEYKRDKNHSLTHHFVCASQTVGCKFYSEDKFAAKDLADATD